MTKKEIEKAKRIEKNIEAMSYAIHSNELAGFVYTKEELAFLSDVAEEKITVEEAIEIIKNKK
ncbi:MULTISPECIES: antitoxin VbhA family protein [Fusobacterium]|uniref:antitoxin VbhA family protein n=1 Tax=Fusobacterium TaxID=848 RepID=UPI0014774831|nr:MULTISPECIES: antitoxin VbhA family protein [Fusobacterium]NME35171.1 antitoxin VbhA family protein [Fusobacterium sp. FSA-380-WT-3A]